MTWKQAAFSRSSDLGVLLYKWFHAKLLRSGVLVNNGKTVNP